jgi:hypothetical protein
VGHDHHRHALVGELFHHVEHLAHEFWVECRRGFVKQHQLRLHGKSPGDGHALLLPTGKLRRVYVELVRQPDLAEQLVGVGLRLLLLGLLDADGGFHHVLDGGEMREEIEELEDHPDLGPLPGYVARVHLVEDVPLLLVNPSTRRRPQPAGVDLLQMVVQRSNVDLPPRGSEEDEGLAWLDHEVDPLEHLQLAERFPYLFGPDHGLPGSGGHVSEREVVGSVIRSFRAH